VRGSTSDAPTVNRNFQMALRQLTELGVGVGTANEPEVIAFPQSLVLLELTI